MSDVAQFNRSVIIERATATANDYGEDVKTWAPYASVRAKILFGTGQERREAAQEAAQQPITAIVKWTPTLAAVLPTDRMQALGAVWDITSIALAGLNDEIHFTAVRSS